MLDSMSQAIRRVRILLAGLLCFAPKPGFAGAFDAALQEIHLASITPAVVVRFCIGQYPEFAATLRSAFSRWQRRHVDLIFEIETPVERAARRKAGKDEQMYAQIVAQHEALLASYGKGYHADLARMPEAERRTGCASYAADLNGGNLNVSDLEAMLAKQLDLIRDKDEKVRTK